MKITLSRRAAMTYLRRTLICSAAAVVPAAADTPLNIDEQVEQAFAFHEPWNKYFRALLGCPDGAVDAAECKPHMGKTEYEAWAKAREAAKDLFQLREK
jgi:hypothetical protein